MSPALQVRVNTMMTELLNEYTPSQILLTIHQITTEYKTRIIGLQDLYSRVSKSIDPNEILARISKYDLELVPALNQIIHNPDDKYWHTNILTIIASELFRISNLWEWLDGEFSDINSLSINSDKLLGIYDIELLTIIQQKIINTNY